MDVALGTKPTLGFRLLRYRRFRDPAMRSRYARYMELCAQSCNRRGLIFPSKAGLVLLSAAGFMSEEHESMNDVPRNQSENGLSSTLVSTYLGARRTPWQE